MWFFYPAEFLIKGESGKIDPAGGQFHAALK